MKNLLLTTAAMLTIATATTAQVQYSSAGAQITISSTEAAIGSGTVSYQWFRNGREIPHSAANSSREASYTVLPEDARYCNQKFQRRARVSNAGCEGTAEGWSNIIEISFCTLFNPNGQGCAACLDVLGPGFDDGYTVAGNLRWLIGDGGCAVSTIQAHAAGHCPNGWRLPTVAEFNALINQSYEWVTSGTRGVPRNGMFFGPRAHSTLPAGACSWPNDMEGCVFLPACWTAVGNANAGANAGTFWSNGAAHHQCLGFTSASASAPNSCGNTSNHSVRCVQANN